MLESNANFDTQNDAATKSPVWVVEFDGIATYFSSGTFSGITASYKKYIKNLDVLSARVDLLAYDTKFGGYEFEIIDDSSNTVLALITANSMKGRRVTVKVGFQELVIGDFITLPESKVINVTVDNQTRVYKFKTESYLADLSNPIFQKMGVTVLNEALDRTETDVDVISTANFQTPNAAPWGAGTETYIMIDKEIMRYWAMAGNQFTVVRGSYGEQTEHSLGAYVYEVIKTVGVYDTLMNIMTTTADGTNGDWDLGIADWGLGIDIDRIDNWQIKNELTAKFDLDAMEFVIDPWKKKWQAVGLFAAIKYWSANHATRLTEFDDAYTWLKNNILPRLPGYFFLTDRGKLGLKIWDVCASNEGIADIAEDDVVGLPQIDSEGKRLANHLVMQCGYNPGTNDFEKTYSETQDESVTEYGTARKIVISAIDPNTYIDGSAANQRRIAERYFGRLANQPVTMDVDLKLKHQLLQAGDIIDLTHSKLVNMRDGSIGWTAEAMEILENHIDFKAGEIVASIKAENVMGLEYVDIQDVHVFEQGDLAAHDLNEAGDITPGVNAGYDAYLDQSAHKACHVMVRFKLTQPGAGGGSTWEYITVVVHVQKPVGLDLDTRTANIYYDETADGVVYADVYALNFDGNNPPVADTPARIKIDWSATSGSNAPSSVEVQHIKFWDFKGTITETSL